MTDPLRGLRFDIYERVHLPDDVAAIEELEEIELVPHMKVLPQDEQVLLKGHLLLSGVYRPQAGSESVSQLEHWIPVEITLPLNRVEKMEELAVDIDNFDVDLLSARSLNVTGVLALRGIQMAAPHIPVWRDDSFTVVHQAPVIPETDEKAVPQEEIAESRSESDFAPVPEPQPQQLSEPEIQSITWPDLARAAEAEPAPEPPVEPDAQRIVQTSDTRNFDEQPADEFYSVAEPSEGLQAAVPEPGFTAEAGIQPEPQQDDALEQWIRAQETEPPAAEAANPYDPGVYRKQDESQHSSWGDISSNRPPEREITFADVYGSVPEERPELKVNVTAPPLAPPARSITGVGILSQLGEKGAARQAELLAMRSLQAETDAAEDSMEGTSKTSTGDELEWTRLFLSKGSEAEPFRKVKLCIVQRDDTLEGIAARYNVQTRDLQKHNRLSDPYLSAGQVIAIP